MAFVVVLDGIALRRIEEVVLRTALVEFVFVERVVIDDDSLALLLPHFAAHVVLIFRGIGAEVGVGRLLEHVVGHVTHLVGLQGLPVVVALRCVLHHLDLRQVGAIGKGHVTDGEVKRRLRVVGIRIRVLEVERLQFCTAPESIRGNTGHERIIVHVARQVVVNLGTVAGNMTWVPSIDCRDKHLFVVHFLHQPTAAVQVKAPLAAIFVA